jgi:hypothetical protein
MPARAASAKQGASLLEFRLGWACACWWRISLKEQGKMLKYLDYRFSVAPMMDWSESLSFSKD